ncbi:MAG TPA: hypothetical protein VLG46_02260, partial [Anaerolineae bacterium]|nr:hypothetical protein [Anaerolineae bacterium]
MLVGLRLRSPRNKSFQNGLILDSNPAQVSASLDHFKAWVAAQPKIKLGISRANGGKHVLSS